MEAPEDLADAGFHVFAGEDERRGGAGIEGEAVEERGVDVGADAEREHAAAMGIVLGGEVADGAFGGAADRGQPVGEEQDEREESGGGWEPEGFGEGVVEVGAAVDADAAEEGADLGHGGGRFDHRPGSEALHRVAVDDHVERLAFVEGFDDLERRFAALFQFGAGHAAGAVQNQDDLAFLGLGDLGGRGVGGGLNRGRRAGEQEEIASVGAGFRIGEEGGRQSFAAAQVGEAERAGLGGGGGGEADGDVAIVPADGFQGVAGGVDGGDRGLGGDPGRELPGDAVVDRLGSGQQVIDAVAVGGEDVFVDQPDLLSGARFEREDTGANQLAADEFEQGGVAGPGDDGVVEEAGLVAGEDFGGGLGGGPVEGEAAEDGGFGDGEDDLGLQPGGGGVGESQVERRGGDLLEDFHRHVGAGYRHRAGSRGEHHRAGLGENEVGGQAAADGGGGLGREGNGEEAGQQDDDDGSEGSCVHDAGQASRVRGARV